MNFRTAFGGLAGAAALIFANFSFGAAQAESIYRLPAGTRIRLKMDVELSSKVASVDDTFTTAVAKPVSIRDIIALPAGTVIQGRVRQVSAAGRGVEDGKLDVVFESLRIPNARPERIEAELVDRVETRTPSFVKVLSLIGGVGLFRKGKNVRIREDEEFDIVLKKDVVLPVQDY